MISFCIDVKFSIQLSRNTSVPMSRKGEIFLIRSDYQNNAIYKLITSKHHIILGNLFLSHLFFVSQSQDAITAGELENGSYRNRKNDGKRET